MNKVRKLKKGGIVALSYVSLLGPILFPAASVNAQRDRTERLQEKVTATDERIHLSKTKAQSQRVNAPAYQAVRKAEKRKKLAQQKLAAIETTEPRKAEPRLAARAGNTQSKKAGSDRVRRARAELDAAEAELNEAKARLKAQ
jgi:hypothetical protein